MTAKEELEAFFRWQVVRGESEISWGNGTILLRIRAYLTQELPPLPSITSVRGLVVLGDSVLVMRNRDDAHILPGGRRQAGESLEETLRREIREEAGIEVRDPKPLGFLHYHHLGPEPQGYDNPYPDFLQAVYLVDACGEIPQVRLSDPDGYETEARFCPIPEARAASAAATQHVFLDAAVNAIPRTSQV